jgi:hypothetical protein
VSKLPSQETGVLNLRDIPRELVANLKAAAAFARIPLKSYLVTVLQSHVTELRNRGTLPKQK